jgi:hypothetical protein
MTQHVLPQHERQYDDALKSALDLLIKLRTNKPSSMARLRAIRAFRELIGIYEAREALAASDEGKSQRAIAEALGRSQSDVHRLLRRARGATPSAVREWILRAAIGQESRGALVGRLGLTHGPGEHDPSGSDGYQPGDLDEVRAALFDGLISESEFEQIVRVRDLDQPPYVGTDEERRESDMAAGRS